MERVQTRLAAFGWCAERDLDPTTTDNNGPKPLKKSPRQFVYLRLGLGRALRKGFRSHFGIPHPSFLGATRKKPLLGSGFLQL